MITHCIHNFTKEDMEGQRSAIYNFTYVDSFGMTDAWRQLFSHLPEQLYCGRMSGQNYRVARNGVMGLFKALLRDTGEILDG